VLQLRPRYRDRELVRCDAQPPDWAMREGPSEFAHWPLHTEGSGSSRASLTLSPTRPDEVIEWRDKNWKRTGTRKLVEPRPRGRPRPARRSCPLEPQRTPWSRGARKAALVKGRSKSGPGSAASPAPADAPVPTVEPERPAAAQRCAISRSMSWGPGKSDHSQPCALSDACGWFNPVFLARFGQFRSFLGDQFRPYSRSVPVADSVDFSTVSVGVMQ